MASLRELITHPALALIAALASSATAVAVALRVDHRLERLTAPRPVDALAGPAPTSSAQELLQRADRAYVQGDLRVASALYQEALATPDAADEDKLAAQLGLARSAGRLGDQKLARKALEAAAAPNDRPHLPAELSAWAEQALGQGAFVETRRLLWGVLALGDGPADKDSLGAIAWAPLRLGDARRAEAGLAGQRAPVRTAPDAPRPWATWLAAVDSTTPAAIRVERGPDGLRASVRAERADGATLLRQLAARGGLELDVPQLGPVAVSARLDNRPWAQALQIVAGACGLDLVPTPAHGWRVELPPPPIDAAGVAAARARSVDAYRLGLERGGETAQRAQLELAELERGADRMEDAAGMYRLLIDAADPEVRHRALLGLARSEAALLRFPRAREALFRLVRQEDARALAPEALLLVAETYSSEGKDGEAEKALRHLVNTFPEAEGPIAGLARLRLGRLLSARRDHEGALAAFQEALPLLPGQAQIDAATGIASELLGVGRPADAVAALIQLLGKQEAARSSGAYLLLAEAYHQAEDHLAALFCLEYVAREHAATAEARQAARQIPRELNEIGLADEAIAALTEAGEVPAARLEVARTCLEEGQVGRARLVLAGLEGAAAELLLARCDLELGDARAATERLEGLSPGSLNAAQRAERARLQLLAEVAGGEPARGVRAWVAERGTGTGPGAEQKHTDTEEKHGGHR